MPQKPERHPKNTCYHCGQFVGSGKHNQYTTMKNRGPRCDPMVAVCGDMFLTPVKYSAHHDCETKARMHSRGIFTA